MVTTPNEILAKLFSPWLRADNNGSLLFINVPEEDDRNTNEEDEVEQTGKLARITKGKETVLGDRECNSKENMGRNAAAEYDNTKMMCPQLDALELTQKLQEIGHSGMLQLAVMEQLSNSNFDINQLAGWAANVLLEFGSKKDRDKGYGWA